MIDIKKRFVDVAGERVYLSRGILDYLDKNNFTRLLDEYKVAEEAGARFYVGLYSNDLLKKHRYARPLSEAITDEDRVELVESLDFVDGAIIIDEINRDKILSKLEYKMLLQREKEQEKIHAVKKYEVGYASGGFDHFHKGHNEHVKIMKSQCRTVIVAVNSDRLIGEYKHKVPEVDDQTRRLILSHNRYVDMAIITDEYDKLKAVEKVSELCGQSFNAIFAGSDWKGDPKWIEFEKKFSEMGIDVVFTDRPEKESKGYISSTDIKKAKSKKMLQKKYLNKSSETDQR
jgi:glycerol-3-phosphate cytidylyltransferase